MDQRTNCGTILAQNVQISQTTNSQKSITKKLYYKAKQDSMSISKKISNDILVIQIFFLTKE